MLIASSQKLIGDDSIGFVFIHLPVPHPGGFYNRQTGAFSVPGSFLDNLALADRALGQLLEWIEESSTARETTVIVSSDHSWRVGLWKASPLWTPEDEATSHGRFDVRPVLMVRFPSDRKCETIGAAFPELGTHALIEGIIAGRIKTRADMQSLLLHRP